MKDRRALLLRLAELANEAADQIDAATEYLDTLAGACRAVWAHCADELREIQRIERENEREREKEVKPS